MRPTLIPLLVVFAACAPTPPSAVAREDRPSASAAAAPASELDLAALSAHPWMLVRINERDVLADPGAQRVALRFEGSRLAGEAPCNVMSAEFTHGPGKLSFGPVTASKRACDALALERELFDALQAVEQAKLEGGALTLSGGGRSVVLHRIAFKR